MQILSFFMILQILTCSESVYSREDQPKIYLATYPRSGNHWLRGLLEEASHIATGSVYRDREPMHLETPFPWGGYAAKHGYEGNCRYPEPDEVAVIKTHFPAKPKTRFDGQRALKIIRIVRHPVDSFYSHFLHQGRELPADGKIPSWFVKKSIRDWQKFENYWNKQSNVLTIRFEDFLEDIHLHFQKIVDAIRYPLSQEDINRAIEKFPPQGGSLKHINDYHQDDLKIILDKLGPLMEKYNYKIDMESGYAI